LKPGWQKKRLAFKPNEKLGFVLKHTDWLKIPDGKLKPKHIVARQLKHD
jgi:hypothetical protein